MDISEEGKDLYVNGRKMPFSLERLVEILELVKRNLVGAFEAGEREDELNDMNNLLDEINKI